MLTNHVQDLIDSEKNNPDLESTLDVPALLAAAENVSSDFLNTHSLSTISQDNLNAIQSTGIIGEQLQNITNKLVEFYHIDYIDQNHKGKHVRW